MTLEKYFHTKKGDRIHPMNQPKPNTKLTYSPHHGYYGSLIVKPLLKNVGMKDEIADYVAEIVRLHLIPFDFYRETKGLAIKDTIDDLKPRMEGLHVEVCFNAYADIAHNPALRDCWKLLGGMFEEPHFYSTRNYFVA